MLEKQIAAQRPPYSSCRPARARSAALVATGLLSLSLYALCTSPLATDIRRGICHSHKHKSGSGSNGSLDDWIKRERSIAWDGVLGNIGPSCGASPGLVIASPSKSKPDYYYTWTRDSALTFLTIFNVFQPPSTADLLIPPSTDHSLEPLLREYVASQRDLQLVSNPSGDFQKGGLGEPKYLVNGSAFEGSWGRPQNDGPPLRAAVLARYVDFLLSRAQPNDMTYISSVLYNSHKLMAPSSVLKSDLEYSAHHWSEDSFDLWEEIQGQHFFTLLALHRSLEMGATLATRLADPGAASFYSSQAALILDRLEEFWLPSEGYIQASLPSSKFGRSGLDSAVLLAVLRSGTAGEEIWGVAGERLLATIVKYVDTFRDLYAINHGDKKGWNGAVAVGRYAEDIYDGVGTSKANPWFICTFAVSETLYRALIHFRTKGSIYVTHVSLPFWRTFHPDAQPRDIYTLGDSSGLFESLSEKVASWADGFLEVARTFEGPGGALSEQFGKDDGLLKGASDLTWSYGAMMDATSARAEYYRLKTHLSQL